LSHLIKIKVNFYLGFSLAGVSKKLSRKSRLETTAKNLKLLFSDISWDNRSEMNLYVDQPTPSRHSRHHYPSSHAVANTKALKEIDRMKEALQQELMHVQYNLDQKDRESKFIYNPVYNSAYPKVTVESIS